MKVQYNTTKYVVFIYHFLYLLSENIKLEKWSAHSVRRAGLCANYFYANSFKTEDKKVLKRNALPIRHYDLINLQEKSNTAMEIEEIQTAQGEQNQINEIEEVGNAYNNATAGTSFHVDYNNKVDNQLHQFQRTYHPAKLNFEKSLEDEDTTEWIHLEPVRDKNIDTHELFATENCKEEKKSEEIIKNLKRENNRLRQTIKRLKLRLQRRQVRPKKKKKN